MVQRQALAGVRKQLGRHAGRLERHPGPILEQAGDADAGRVEIEDRVEAQLGLQLREPPYERDLSRRWTAGNPDHEIVAVSERQQVAERLAVLNKNDAAQRADERELDLVDLRRPQVALAVAERSAQFNDPIVLRDQLRERLPEQPLEQRAAAVGPGLGVVDLAGELARPRTDTVPGQIGQPLRGAEDRRLRPILEPFWSPADANDGNGSDSETGRNARNTPKSLPPSATVGRLANMVSSASPPPATVRCRPPRGKSGVDRSPDRKCQVLRTRGPTGLDRATVTGRCCPVKQQPTPCSHVGQQSAARARTADLPSTWA
jgi:hypothetical protein